jgi:hypothetical protein
VSGGELGREASKHFNKSLEKLFNWEFEHDELVLSWNELGSEAGATNDLHRRVLYPQGCRTS